MVSKLPLPAQITLILLTTNKENTMHYAPKTDEQLEAERPRLREGIIDWEIISTLLKDGEKINKDTGNLEKYKYFELNIKVYDSNGTQGFVKEFLSNQPKMIWKLKQFCDAAALHNEYMNPPLECFMLNGKCGRGMGHFQKNKDPNYADQFKIKSFNIKEDEDKAKPPLKQQSDSMDKFEDEDIPF